MACGCNNKNKGSNYLYQGPNGQQKVYTSEVQAKVAQIQNGGGTITPIPK